MEKVNTMDKHGSKIVRNRVFDCYLSPDWRQMAIENTVSSNFDPHSSIVKCLFALLPIRCYFASENLNWISG